MPNTITEILKRKWLDTNIPADSTRIQNEARHKLAKHELSFIINEDKSNFLDYVSKITRQRAQTVGLAYQIGFKILVAVSRPHEQRVRLLTDALYKKETFKDVPSLLSEYTYVNLFKQYTDVMDALHFKLNCEDRCQLDKEMINYVANVAVVLAWFESYRRSGFFPRNLDVMDMNSPTHVDLVAELDQLLHNSLQLVAQVSLMDVCFYPKFNLEVADIVQHFDISFFDLATGTDVLVELSTTANPDSYITDVLPKFAYLNIIINDYKTPGYKKMPNVLIFFPRYAYSVSPVLIERKIPNE